MSWNFSVGPVKGELLSDAIAEAIAEKQTQVMQSPDTDEEVSRQMRVAKECVEYMIGQGALGSDQQEMRATLSGHANPSHERRQGYSGDTVNVSVSVA